MDMTDATDTTVADTVGKSSRNAQAAVTDGSLLLSLDINSSLSAFVFSAIKLNQQIKIVASTAKSFTISSESDAYGSRHLSEV